MTRGMFPQRSAGRPEPDIAIVGAARPAPRMHGLVTRLIHAGLALAVTGQLLTSLGMVAPRPQRAANRLFEVHEYGGLTALALVSVLLIHLSLRLRGTERGLLFPWLSPARRSALWQDIAAHGRQIRSLRLPIYEDGAPLASAVHGLGLALVAAMATTGSVSYAASSLGFGSSAAVALGLDVHRALANLVWAYLIGHAGMAVLRHYSQHLSLGEMWSFRRQGSAEGSKP